MTAFESLLNQVLEEVRIMLIEKNKSYGDSALHPQSYFSRLGARERLYVRIDDKINRIAKGSEYGQEDTKLDLLGYFILDRMLTLLDHGIFHSRSSTDSNGAGRA